MCLINTRAASSLNPWIYFEESQSMRQGHFTISQRAVPITFTRFTTPLNQRLFHPLKQGCFTNWNRGVSLTEKGVFHPLKQDSFTKTGVFHPLKQHLNWKIFTHFFFTASKMIKRLTIVSVILSYQDRTKKDNSRWICNHCYWFNDPGNADLL